MRGFKEDFDAWRSSLTPEERAMVQKQAQGEFNKNFLKSWASFLTMRPRITKKSWR